ncbi:hypothetical protein [Streptomyces sp. NPDC006691]|uniref:hypothetical protein n=1 Tax=Streptomyces sp. NPDC006691 TaxID=3364757 RepID=UPI0036B7C79B
MQPEATGTRPSLLWPKAPSSRRAGRADSGATLAETGSDAAAGWTLGAGGASIARAQRSPAPPTATAVRTS